MSESLKPRFAVDLDEIERQLAQAQAAPASPAPAGRNDPLAELARIVGQDDPFHSLLASDRTPARPPEPQGFDDLFVTRGYATDLASHVPAPGPLRGSLDAHDSTGRHRDAIAAHPDDDYQAHYAEPHQAQFLDDPATYAPDAYGAGYGPEGPGVADPVLEEADAFHGRARPGRRRRSAVAVGAVLGAAVLGVGGVLVLSGGKTVLSSGEPPLIEATGEPTKVQPQSPGGVEIPNQNKQIFERAGYETQTKVVNREEQPVDIRQAARAGMEAAGTTSASTSPVDSQPANLGLNLGEPRRVRTISIRPDGTVLGAEASTPQPAAPVAASVPVPVTPLTAQPVAAAGSAETGTRQVATTPAASALRAATPSPAQASGGGSPQAVPTTPAAPAPRAATLPPAQASGAGSPQAVLAAASPPAPQRVASVAPIPIAPAPAPSAEAVQAGGFAVQLGFSQSEGEARALFQRLQQKFADLASIAPMIRQAEVNGNTIYRVRVGPMGRDDASSLCAKLQGQGGQCFVAKN